jgi:protein-S-isoprenylcysteine O-methyltransferase Ste14
MSFLSEVAIYVSRVRQFRRDDWMVYLAWVGVMVGLCLSTGGFLGSGHLHGVRFPEAAWLVPVGAVVFTVSIAIDTIGHRTIYKEAIKGAEKLVHSITIFAGIASCVLLCAAYGRPAPLDSRARAHFDLLSLQLGR